MPRTLLLMVLVLLLTPHAARAQEDASRLDRFGDPLPPGALARLGTVRFKRAGATVYSPDGKTIVTLDRDGAHLWEAATGKKIHMLPDENRSSSAVRFSHDGKKLAIVGWGGDTVDVWDAHSFKKIFHGEANGGSGGMDWSNAAAFSADDKTLYSATSSAIYQWDAASGKKLKELPFHANGKDVFGSIVSFSDDGKVAATRGSNRAEVHLWDVETGNLLHIVAVRTGETMKFSTDGKLLAVPTWSSWMSIIDVETGQKIHSMPVSERVLSMAFSPDGKTMAAASNITTSSSRTEGEQVVQFWDLANLKAAPVKYQAPGIHYVTYSPDGKTLAWGSHRQSLSFMDPATGKDQRPTASHRGPITSLVYFPDGKRVATASEDGTIRIWDAATGAALSVLEGHECEVLGLGLYPNGKLLASCGRDSTLRLWDVGTPTRSASEDPVERGKALAVLSDEGNSIVAAAFSPDGKRFVSGGYRGVLFLRDPATGKILEEFEPPAADFHRSISSLAFAPDGKTVAAIGRGGKLLVQDLVTAKLKEIRVEEKERGGSSVAYSADGKYLAAAYSTKLFLLDRATHRVLRSLPISNWNDHGCVVFSPDSRYLAGVGEGRRTMRVFELATGTEIHEFKGDLPIFAAAFSPDSSKLAVGGADTTALILDMKNLSGKKRREQLTEDELTAHWTSLADPEAAKVNEARADLLHAAKSSVPFLAKRLQPAPAVDAKRVQELISRLDDDAFRVRDEATRELEKLGELVREPLRKALAGDLPAETRQRLGLLLNKLNDLSPSRLRTLRGIEILEGIGTPEALGVVERLTQGNPDGFITVESKAVTARLKRRSEPLPPSPVARKSPADSPPAGPVLRDLDGDPMPAGAIARLGSTRWRLADQALRILVADDVKRLAAVNGVSGVEMFDSRTGSRIPSAGAGISGCLAISADWRKVAAQESDGAWRPPILAVYERDRSEKVKIYYARKKLEYPVVPEEVESGNGSSSGWSEYLSSAAFSPDGKTLVGSLHFKWEGSSGKFSKRVNETHLIAWDASTGKRIWKALVPAKAKALAPIRTIHTILFSADGQTMTVVDETGVGLWDAASGKELRRWESGDPLFSACFSPDRRVLATGTKDEILLWDVAAGTVRRRLPLAGAGIVAVAFSPDGKLLAGGGDKSLCVWDPATGGMSLSETVSNPPQAVAFSADGKTLFSGHVGENVLRRWDVAGRKPLGGISGPITPLRMLSFSKDGGKILASSTGEDFYLGETATGQKLPLPQKVDDGFLSEWIASSGQAALLRCEEGRYSRFGSYSTGRMDHLDQLPGFVESSVDGRRVLVESAKDKMLCLTVLKVGEPNPVRGRSTKRQDDIEREFVWKDSAPSAALSPDGKTVAAAGRDVVCLFDVATGAERRFRFATDVEPEYLFHLQSIRFADDGSRLAVSGRDGKVRILAVRDGRRIAEFAVKSREVSGLAFAPDGQTLLTASYNAPAFVWEVATGQKVRRLEAATYLFSPDNRMLVRGAETLKVFDLYSGRAMRECRADGSALVNFAFSPSSKFLAASCSDTTIVVWPTASLAVGENKGPLDEKSLAEVLEKGNAAEAYEAIGRMIADPERTLAFLERRLRRMQRVDPKDMKDDEKALVLSADDVLHVRAVQVLERIGTKQARQLLENLAQGTETSPRTRAAAEALRRLEAR